MGALYGTFDALSGANGRLRAQRNRVKAHARQAPQRNAYILSGLSGRKKYPERGRAFWRFWFMDFGQFVSIGPLFLMLFMYCFPENERL